MSGNDDSKNSVWALGTWFLGSGDNKLPHLVMRVCLSFGFSDLGVDASLSTGISAVQKCFVFWGLAILIITALW